MLGIKQVAVYRDIENMSTNAIYRFESAFDALRPMLRGLILPPSIKAKLSELEGHDNLEITTVLHLLMVEKDITKQKLLPHKYVKILRHLTLYFNNLHFRMMHVIEFIEEYGIYGLPSSESHESVDAR